MRGNGDISMEAMRAHLDTVFIGFRPGDPTAGPPPATMPAPGVPQPRGLTTVDLRQTTMAELHAQAAATQPRDVFAALLPNPPGAPPGRIAYVSGREPSAGQKKAQEAQQQQQQQQPQQQKQQKQQKQRQQPSAPG